MVKREYSFRVALSEQEKEQLQQEADRLGLSMTDVVRQFIRQLPKGKDDESNTIER